MPDRQCATCKHFESAPIRRKGWCRNPKLYSPQQSHLVDRDDLDCGHRLGNYWESADTHDDTAPTLHGADEKAEAGPVRLLSTKPRLAPATAGVVARSPLSSGGSGTAGGGRGGGSGQTPPPGSSRPGRSGGPPSSDRGVDYQPEERYWTDYLRIIFPALGLVLLLGLLWFWADRLIGDDDGASLTAAEQTATAVGGLPTPTPTSMIGTPAGGNEGGAEASPTDGADQPDDETPTPRPTRTPRSTEEDDDATEETTPVDDGGDGFSEGDLVRTTEDGVNLRSDPTTAEENVLETLLAGTVLTVIGDPESGDDRVWIPVRNDETGNEGWVAQDFVEAAS